MSYRTTKTWEMLIKLSKWIAVNKHTRFNVVVVGFSKLHLNRIQGQFEELLKEEGLGYNRDGQRVTILDGDGSVMFRKYTSEPMYTVGRGPITLYDPEAIEKIEKDVEQMRKTTDKYMDGN